MKNLKIIIPTIIVICAILFIGFIILLNKTYEPTMYEKDEFKNDEVKTIESVFEIKSNEVSIEKLKYNHAKDSVFLLFSTVDEENVENVLQNYGEKTEYTGKSMKDSLGDEYCVNKNDNKLYCYLRKKDDNKYQLVFQLSNYNKDLLNILENTK